MCAMPCQCVFADERHSGDVEAHRPSTQKLCKRAQVLAPMLLTAYGGAQARDLNACGGHGCRLRGGNARLKRRVGKAERVASKTHRTFASENIYMEVRSLIYGCIQAHHPEAERRNTGS